MENIDCQIVESIEKIVAVAEEKNLPKTAEILRDATFIALLEYRNKCGEIDRRESIRVGRNSQNYLDFVPSTKLIQ